MWSFSPNSRSHSSVSLTCNWFPSCVSVCENPLRCNYGLNTVLVFDACWPVTEQYSNNGAFHCVDSSLLYIVSSKMGQICSLLFARSFLFMCACLGSCVCVCVLLSVVVLLVTLDFVLPMLVLFFITIVWPMFEAELRTQSNSSVILKINNCKNLTQKKVKVNHLFQSLLTLSFPCFAHIKAWLMATRVNGLRWRSSCGRRRSSSWASSKTCRWATAPADSEGGGDNYLFMNYIMNHITQRHFKGT